MKINNKNIIFYYKKKLKLFWNCYLLLTPNNIMSEEVERKMKEAKSLHQKYVQMIEEYTLKENIKNEDFNRRIMKVYNCMISEYNEINQEIGFLYK